MSEDKTDSGAKDRLIRPVAAGRWPRGISCEGGFRILGTPLGFARARSANLRFLSSVDDLVPGRGSRILATPFLAEALGAEERGLDALTLDHNRTIRLGRMDIRQMPAGLGPGSSQLEVSFRERKIVFSGGVRLAAPLASPPAEISRCDLLLFDTPPAEPRPPSPRRVATKIEEWVRREVVRGRAPVLAAGTLGAALETAFIARRLELPVRATRTLFELMRRVEPLGLAFPLLRRLEQDLPPGGIVLHLARLWADSPAATRGSGPVAYVGPGRAKPDWADAGFRLGEGEDRPGIVSYVERTKASQIALGPRCDEGTASLLGKAGLSVYRVHDPTQMPLPF